MRKLLLAALLAASSMSAEAWDYRDYSGPMSSSVTRSAEVPTTAPLGLEFPYAGAVAALEVLNFGKGRWSVYVKVSKGQFNCNGERCMLPVRFDDRPTQRYPAWKNSGSKYPHLEIEYSQKFIDNLKKSKKVVIAVDFFMQDYKFLEFNIEGFDVKRMK